MRRTDITSFDKKGRKMSVLFADVVEEIKQLSSEEKNDLKNILERLLIEERREDIAHAHAESHDEYKAGKLRFSSNIKDLKDMMNND